MNAASDNVYGPPGQCGAVRPALDIVGTLKIFGCWCQFYGTEQFHRFGLGFPTL